MMHNNEREVHAGFFFCVCRYFSPMSSLGAKKNAEPVHNACLNYYSESNFEYSRSISDYSESIAQLSAVWYLT